MTQIGVVVLPELMGMTPGSRATGEWQTDQLCSTKWLSVHTGRYTTAVSRVVDLDVIAVGIRDQDGCLQLL